MAREVRKIGSFSAVGASQTATQQIPLNATYYNLILETQGLTLSQMEDIRVKINAQTFRQHSATELNRINVYNGRKTNGNSGTGKQYLMIDFHRPYLRTLPERVFTAIGTGVPGDPKTNPNPVRDFVIEVDIAAGVNAPKMTLYAEIDLPAPTGQIKYYESYTWVPGAAGTVAAPAAFDFINYPKGRTIQRIYAWRLKNGAIQGTHLLDYGQIINDNEIMYEVPAKMAKVQQQDGFGGLNPDDWMFVINPSFNGDGSNGFSTVYTGGALAGSAIADQRIRYGVMNITPTTDVYKIFLERIGAPRQ